MSASWLRTAGADVVLTLHIQPGARKAEVAGEHGEALKIRLNAPPVDGKANEALINFLANQLKVPKSRVILEAGQTARAKRVRIVDAGEADAIAALLIGPGQ